VSDPPAVSGGVEDRPFGLQHRLGDLTRLWGYQVDVCACGISVEQNIVQKFGFLIGRVRWTPALRQVAMRESCSYKRLRNRSSQ
jgi:hypothetical protein